MFISSAPTRALTSGARLRRLAHGLPRDLLAPTLHPRSGYLAFLGRISPEKRVDRAIDIARAVGLPLKIAAKVDRVDQGYFERDIRPLLNLPGIEYIGEIDERAKGKFLGDALALLFPIDWPEPFGLVMLWRSQRDADLMSTDSWPDCVTSITPAGRLPARLGAAPQASNDLSLGGDAHSTSQASHHAP